MDIFLLWETDNISNDFHPFRLLHSNRKLNCFQFDTNFDRLLFWWLVRAFDTIDCIAETMIHFIRYQNRLNDFSFYFIVFHKIKIKWSSNWNECILDVIVDEKAVEYA